MESNNNNNPYPNFILGVQNGMATMTLKAANAILGSKENFYRLVQDEGYFIPALSSRAITNDYLRGVLNGTFYQFLSRQIMTPPKPKKVWSKIEMITYIKTRIGLERDLGFGPTNMPDEDFLVTICYTLDQNLDMFTGIKEEDEIIAIPVNFLDKLRFFDPNCRGSRNNVIPKSNQQKEKEKRVRLEKRRNRKIRRVELINSEKSKLESEVDYITDLLQERDENI
jgi:hypothetical protein